jgi:hypothetical protein
MLKKFAYLISLTLYVIGDFMSYCMLQKNMHYLYRIRKWCTRTSFIINEKYHLNVWVKIDKS